jgi:hypothetical protein
MYFVIKGGLKRVKNQSPIDWHHGVTKLLLKAI